MGEVIRLAERRAAREARAVNRVAPARVEFLFDLCCPFSYLAADRIFRRRVPRYQKEFGLELVDVS